MHENKLSRLVVVFALAVGFGGCGTGGEVVEGAEEAESELVGAVPQYKVPCRLDPLAFFYNAQENVIANMVGTWSGRGYTVSIQSLGGQWLYISGSFYSGYAEYLADDLRSDLQHHEYKNDFINYANVGYTSPASPFCSYLTGETSGGAVASTATYPGVRPLFLYPYVERTRGGSVMTWRLRVLRTVETGSHVVVDDIMMKKS